MSKGLSVGRPTSGKSENVDHQGKKPALQQHFGKFGLLHALRNPEVHGKIGRWWNQPTNQPLLESFADWYHIPWLTNSLVCCQPPCHEVCGCFCWCDSGWTHMRYCLLERLGWSTCSTSGSARGVPSFLDLYKACWIKHTHYRLCWQFLTFLTIFMFLCETSWVPNKIDSFALKITAGWIRPCWASCFSTSWTSMGGDRNLSPCLWASFKCSSRMSYAAEWCWSETLESMNHLNGSKMLQGRTMLQNSSTRFKAAVSYRWRFEAVDRAAGRIKKIGKKKKCCPSCVKESRFAAVLQPTAFQSIWFYVWLIFVAYWGAAVPPFLQHLDQLRSSSFDAGGTISVIACVFMDACLIGWFQIFNWKLGCFTKH